MDLWRRAWGGHAVIGAIGLPALLACSSEQEPLVHLPAPELAAQLPPIRSAACPASMVDVGGRFCIDRFEGRLRDASTGRELSPYYHPTPELASRDRKSWNEQRKKLGSFTARQTELPELPAWQLGNVRYAARSERGQIPSAYLDRDVAEKACKNAGKRLCSHEEWLTACRGENKTRHPYGDDYVAGRCNVSGPLHPGGVLHGPARTDGLDPRMNEVEYKGARLLQTTGARAECKSTWGDDAIYDMVGNLDEWVDDPGGTFLGGFYARDSHWGCDMRVAVHSADYYDYSLGVRCCRDSAR